MAHEDHPRRAVLAALSIQRQFKAQIGQPISTDKRQLGLRIGLHTGHVLVSRVKHAKYLTSTAIEGMNDWVIACQKQAAPDTILVSEATMPYVQDIVRLDRQSVSEACRAASKPIKSWPTNGVTCRARDGTGTD